MRTLPAGPHALIVELDDQADALALYAEIERRRHEPDDWPWPQPSDVVPAARTVLIDGLQDPEPVASAIADWAGWESAPSDVPERALVTCPVLYDGPDLDAVAAHWGVSREAAVQLHTHTEFVVAFCGFAPGFAYLTGLPAERTVPRHRTPRERVPAGSVALAGEYSAVYPSASPGGWQLIGTSTIELWDAARDPAALLTPGTLVRFVVEDGR